MGEKCTISIPNNEGDEYSSSGATTLTGDTSSPQFVRITVVDDNDESMASSNDINARVEDVGKYVFLEKIINASTPLIQYFVCKISLLLTNSGTIGVKWE